MDPALPVATLGRRPAASLELDDTKPTPPFDHRSWIRTWLRTAIIGTAIIALIFLLYEVAERVWLREVLDLDDLFRLHVARGVGTSIVIGTWAFFSIRAMRRRYENAIAETYAALSAAFDQRAHVLARAQLFSERLFDALRDRLVVVDRRGRVLKANRVARAAVGWKDTPSHCRMKGADCWRSGCVALRVLEDGAPVLGDVRADAAGRIFSIDAYPVPDPESGEEVVLEVARDVTEAKQLEANLAAQEKLAALGVLAAGIAHDIANPLASISSELELLETEKDVEGVRRSVSVLQRHLDRISRTLREMTDFARRRGDDREHVDVAEAVEDALRMVRHDPRARRVRFELDVPRSLPELLLVEDRLVMMLVNLLINGLDAMPNGGAVRVRARPAGDGLVVEVTDTGVGMTPDVRERALEPLFTTKASGHGTGLGLTVTADSMRAVGGSVEIDSEPDRGTTIRLCFPAAVLMPPKEKPCPSAS